MAPGSQVRTPTHWAWRQPELHAKLALVPHGPTIARRADYPESSLVTLTPTPTPTLIFTLTLTRRANYSEFSLVKSAEDLVSGALDQGLMRELLSLATDPARADRLRGSAISPPSPAISLCACV